MVGTTRFELATSPTPRWNSTPNSKTGGQGRKRARASSGVRSSNSHALFVRRIAGRRCEHPFAVVEYVPLRIFTALDRRKAGGCIEQFWLCVFHGISPCCCGFSNKRERALASLTELRSGRPIFAATVRFSTQKIEWHIQTNVYAIQFAVASQSSRFMARRSA
jgi:hypothetical protein